MGRVKHLYKFLLVSFLLTYVITILFMSKTEISGHSFISTSASIYYLTTLPFYYYIILLAIAIFFTPLVIISKYFSYIFVTIKSIFDYYLLIDFFVFRLYKYHIDPLFINMLLNDFGGIGFTYYGIIIAITVFLIISIVNYYIFLKSETMSVDIIKINFLIIFLFILNQTIHIWASYFKQDYVTKYTPYFPYYFPTTSSGKMRYLSSKYSFIIPDHIGNDNKISLLESGIFKYPKKRLKFNKTKKYNIVFIVLESWQARELNKEVMPHLYEFAKENVYFNDHYSNGSVTLTGLYSLMYGLYPTENLKASMSNPLKYSSIFTRALKEMGYDISLYTTSNFYRFSFKDMFFPRLDDNFSHIEYQGDPVTNDKKIIGSLIEEINISKDTPWFKFIFLTSSHFPYRYPKEFEKFTPVPRSMESFVFDRESDPRPFKNKYRNSLLYLDSLIGGFLEKTKGALENSIIVITGDHSEEFNENRAGFWGHGSNFTKFQTKVPLIIHFPIDMNISTKRRTFHLDIVPTVLKFIGVKNDVEDFSNGINLMEPQTLHRNTVFASYKAKGYLVDDNITSVGLFIEKYSLDDYKKKTRTSVDKLQKLREKEGSFFVK